MGSEEPTPIIALEKGSQERPTQYVVTSPGLDFVMDVKITEADNPTLSKELDIDGLTIRQTLDLRDDRIMYTAHSSDVDSDNGTNKNKVLRRTFFFTPNKSVLESLVSTRHTSVKKNKSESKNEHQSWANFLTKDGVRMEISEDDFKFLVEKAFL